MYQTPVDFVETCSTKIDIIRDLRLVWSRLRLNSMTIALDLTIPPVAECHLFVHSIFNVIVIHRLDYLKHIRVGLDILKCIRG
jgi:hypothetical protein